MKEIKFSPIGVIHSPFKDLANIPVQPSYAHGIKGSIELMPEYIEGISDLDIFSHIILLYHFHRSRGFSLKVVPFMGEHPRGVFATRAPKRPNPIGISIVKLTGIENNILHIENVDILDNTPLLDIKPYVPQLDGSDEVSSVQLTRKKIGVQGKKPDRRLD